jgi:WD40 repeat protein
VTGRIRHVLPGHGFGTTALSWSPQGGILASSGQDGKVKLWKVPKGQLHLTLDGGAAWVERVTWSPEGTLLAAAAGKKVRLWNTAGELVREYANHPSTVADIRWKPGTLELASAAYGQIALFHPDQAEPVRSLKWKGSQLVLAWSPDGKHMATGDQDSTVHFWFMKNGEDLMMSGYPVKVRELSWDYTSRFLATGGGAVPCVWDVSGKGPAGTRPLQFEGHAANVTGLAFQHSGPLLASAGADGLVMLWHPGKHKRPLATTELPAGITQIAWSGDDQRLAAGTESGRVAVLSLN